MIMKTIKSFLLVLLTTIAVPILAQAQNNQQITKEAGNVRVQVVNGQDHLVLLSGRKALTYNPDIVILLDTTALALFNRILSGDQPKGRLKDVDGKNVDVALASVNGESGLMFTSGTKCVAVKKEYLDAIRY